MESKITRILFITKGSNDSGNFITMYRISNNMQTMDKCIETKIFHINNQSTIGYEFEHVYNQWQPEIIFGLNLNRCSFLTNVVDLKAKIIMILGGTDINSEMNDSVKLKSIRLIEKCQRIVAFSDEMKSTFQKQFSQVLNGLKLQIDVIPQGINVFDSPKLGNNPYVDQLLKDLKIIDSSIFLVVGRLRSVKDPGFIINPFIKWININGHWNYRLLYVGDVEEESDDIINFIKLIKRFSNIHHIGSLPQEQVFDLMIRSKALINCSQNEGQSTTILEAMSIGLAILARNVPGNREIVFDNYNGLLFNDEKDFMENLTKIINKEFSENLIIKAKKYVSENHDTKNETLRYLDICEIGKI